MYCAYHNNWIIIHSPVARSTVGEFDNTHTFSIKLFQFRMHIVWIWDNIYLFITREIFPIYWTQQISNRTRELFVVDWNKQRICYATECDVEHIVEMILLYNMHGKEKYAHMESFVSHVGSTDFEGKTISVVIGNRMRKRI